MKNKLILISMATMMVAGFVYSQVYFHQQSRKDLKEIAREIALTWQEKLDLTVIQALQLEGVIIAYTIRKNDVIQADIPEHKKIKRLQKIQAREHKTLRKILNEEQFNAYVGINKKIPNNIMDSLSAG